MSIKPFAQASAVSGLKRVCVIFPGALGDFVCFLPALRSLARNAEIDLFARSEFAGIVPQGIALHSLESAEIRNLFVEDPRLGSALESYFGGFAAVYSWLGSEQPVYVRRLQTLSQRRAKCFAFRPPATGEHQADYYLRCLGRANWDDWAAPIEPGANAIAWGDEFWKQNTLEHSAVLAVGAGSGAREKNWPEQYFLDAARWWREATGGGVVLLVGPVEMERGGTLRLQTETVVARDLTLAQAVAVLRRSALYLGNDSGITHLAAAVGTATIALFGPSDPRQWAPRGRRVSVIRRALECSPCDTLTMKRCPHRACLTELDAENLIAFMRGLPEVAALTR